MYLVSINVQNSTLVMRKHLDSALQTVGLNAPWLVGKTSADLVSQRCSADAVRVAISYVMSNLPGIRYQDANCRLVHAEAKTESQEVRIDIHLRTKMKAVDYPHIGWFSYTPNGGTSRPTWNPNPNLAPEVLVLLPESFVKQTQNPGDLYDVGMTCLVNSDMRRVCQSLLAGLPKLKKRAGDWLALTEEQHKQARATAAVLKQACSCSPGIAGLEFFKGENNEENKANMARDLGEAYTERMEALLEAFQKCYEKGKVQKQWDGLLAEYDQYCGEVESLVTILENSFPPEYHAAFTAISSWLVEVQEAEEALEALEIELM